MDRLSVVVVNHDYEEFVGIAIESALAIRWGDIEVVVVDDGSTDGSQAVIEGYGDRVVALFTENSTQRVAVNRGFAVTSGDVVVFLDSDDVLPPDLAEHLAAAWTPAASKVQFRMQRIDRSGAAFGDPFPAFDRVPSPSQIRRWALRTTAYPTPPGSGNAYARSFLERILPVGPALGNAADSACLAAAPFLGDVITVPEVVVGYRRHGANDSDLLADDRRFAREVARARARWHFVRYDPAVALVATEDPLFRSRELLQLRTVALRLTPGETTLPGDGRCRALLDAVRSPWQVGPEPASHRLAVAGWCVVTLLAPLRLVRRLVALRYGRRADRRARPGGAT